MAGDFSAIVQSHSQMMASPFGNGKECRKSKSNTLRVWTTHDEYLAVFIAVQTLVGIGVVILKICDFQYYANLV